MTVKVFDRVDDSIFTHQVREPGEQQVRFVPEVAGERPAAAALEGLQLPSQLERLWLADGADRMNATILAELLDL
jgi:hypothetical protein